MATAQAPTVPRNLGQPIDAETSRECTDLQLLERFRAGRDEAAFGGPLCDPTAGCEGVAGALGAEQLLSVLQGLLTAKRLAYNRDASPVPGKKCSVAW